MQTFALQRIVLFAHARLRVAAVAITSLALASCSIAAGEGYGQASSVRSIQILALNDFHGHLEQPESPVTWQSADGERQARLGGAAHLGAVLEDLRIDDTHTVTVAAGDLISASPLVSAYHLDEPSIIALNRMGLDVAAVGNHEFDRGINELERMQHGGCEQFTLREPCALDPDFEGARFTFLAGNVLDDDGNSLFPGTAMREIGGISVGFIGLTLKETGVLVAPSGTAGYRFTDEAETANALAAQLLAEGAEAIVLLIHQGGYVTPRLNEHGCDGLDGPILPILDRLSDEIGIVVSGHTHAAYVCTLQAPGRPDLLLTSAGSSGAFVTDIRLQFDRRLNRVVEMEARNIPVTADRGEQAEIAALVDRYVRAAEPIAARAVGTISGELGSFGPGLGSALAALIADAQLEATRAPDRGAAQIAFMNSGGVRGQLMPGNDGSVTYGQLYSVQPFGNTLVVLEMAGADVLAVLEQQFSDQIPAGFRHSQLIPSRGFTYEYDPEAPVGERVGTVTLEGAPIDPRATYRVTVSNFLASGGDGFSLFSEARNIADGGVDLDALEAYVAGGVAAPDRARITLHGS